MFAIANMRDATYVMVALMLSLIILVFVIRTPAKSVSMLDLLEFKTLPVELRSAVKRVLPEPRVIRQQWGSMTPDQKQGVVQAITGVIPHPRHHHQHPMPAPAPEPVASVVIEAEPEPVASVDEPVASVDEPGPVPVSEPMKKGFLLNDVKKKNTKDKKKDKVVTFGHISPDDSSTPDSSSGFLGRDD